MTALTFKLKADLEQRVNLAMLTPSQLAGRTIADIERLEIATTRVGLRIGDIFTLTGQPGENIVVEGASNKMDHLACKMDGGTVHVEGSIGAYAARQMTAGTLSISGDAGDGLASCLAGGLVKVAGNVGNRLAAPRRGERFGMTGGAIVVTGTIGERAGDRMRRGTIVSHQSIGSFAASRMMGGTIWAESGFGAYPGILMRRGTLIAPSVSTMLPTFNDCGAHRFIVLRLLQTHLKTTLGQAAPAEISLTQRKFSGDTATVGKGELFLTA
ncbi:MAG: formylmethanofuran dehydrogenase subunit C [Hyphomicrobiaceae bacterium]